MKLIEDANNFINEEEKIETTEELITAYKALKTIQTYYETTEDTLTSEQTENLNLVNIAIDEFNRKYKIPFTSDIFYLPKGEINEKE